VTCDPEVEPGTESVPQSELFHLPESDSQNGPTTLPVIYGPAYFNADLGLFKNFAIAERKKLQLRMNA
jgi:hypothetical protein